MALQRTFVGIDVSKEWLDLWLAPQKRFERAGNDGAGWAAVIGLLQSLGPEAGVVVAFEATGGYEQGLRRALLEAGFDVRRLNPLRVRLYAKSLGRNAKNDRIDARVIARYAEAADVTPDILDPARERLAELVSHRRRLVDERVAVGNQTNTLHCVHLQAQNRKPCADRAPDRRDRHPHPRGGRASPEPRRQGRAAQDPEGRQGRHGNCPCRPAARTRPDHATRHRRARRSCPFDHDSGKLNGTRSIAGGRAAVRTVLYMAARAAARSKSPLGEFYKRLIAAGKSPKVATVALMRKMLVTLNAMIRHNQA
jgi:transposase